MRSAGAHAALVFAALLALVYADCRATRRSTPFAQRASLEPQAVHMPRVHTLRSGAVPAVPVGSTVPLAAQERVAGTGMHATGSVAMVEEHYELLSSPATALDQAVVELEARFVLAETGRRNFLPAPVIGLSPLFRYYDVCHVEVDGEAVGCIRQADALVFDAQTAPGQEIALTWTSSWHWPSRARVRVLDDVAYTPLAFVGVHARWASRDGLREPWTVDLRAGLPLLGPARVDRAVGRATRLPLVLDEPGRDGVQVIAREASFEESSFDPTGIFPEASAGALDFEVRRTGAPGGAGRPALVVSMPAAAEGVQVPLLDAVGIALRRASHGTGRPRDADAFGRLGRWAFGLFVLTFFSNALLLLCWFVSIGWVLALIDKLAGTRLLRDVLMPKGRIVFFHPTAGTVLGWTAVLVPFRLASLLLRATFALVLRLHPRIALMFGRAGHE